MTIFDFIQINLTREFYDGTFNSNNGLYQLPTHLEEQGITIENGFKRAQITALNRVNDEGFNGLLTEIDTDNLPQDVFIIDILNLVALYIEDGQLNTSNLETRANSTISGNRSFSGGNVEMTMPKKAREVLFSRGLKERFLVAFDEEIETNLSDTEQDIQDLQNNKQDKAIAFGTGSVESELIQLETNKASVVNLALTDTNVLANTNKTQDLTSVGETSPKQDTSADNSISNVKFVKSSLTAEASVRQGQIDNVQNQIDIINSTFDQFAGLYLDIAVTNASATIPTTTIKITGFDTPTKDEFGYWDGGLNSYVVPVAAPQIGSDTIEHLTITLTKTGGAARKVDVFIRKDGGTFEESNIIGTINLSSAQTNISAIFDVGSSFNEAGTYDLGMRVDAGADTFLNAVNYKSYSFGTIASTPTNFIDLVNDTNVAGANGREVINNLNTLATGNAVNITTNITSINSNKTDIGILPNLDTINKADLVQAVNEIVANLIGYDNSDRNNGGGLAGIIYSPSLGSVILLGSDGNVKMRIEDNANVSFQNMSMNNNKITKVSTPTIDDDGATKLYADENRRAILNILLSTKTITQTQYNSIEAMFLSEPE